MSAPPSGDGTTPPTRSGPPGEGWDDGRGGTRRAGRSGGARRSRGADRSGSASRNPWSGATSRLPRWLIPAVVVGLLLVVVLVVVLTRGGDGPSDSGTCLTDVLSDLPAADAGHLALTDVVQARSSGYDDEGDLEAAGDSIEASGAIPDGLTSEIRFGRLDSVDEFSGSTGVDPGDIRCSVRSSRSTVLGGTFAPPDVEGTDLAGSGRLLATEDRLALVRVDGDPRTLVQAADDPLGDVEPLIDVVDSLRDQGAYSAIVDWDVEADGATGAGIGVAGAGDDDRQLVLAWSFDDEGSARAGRQGIVETVNDLGRGSASIGVEDLQLDGSLVTAAIDVRKAPDLAGQWDLGTRLLPKAG